MYLKKALSLISFFAFLYIFSMSAYAAPTEKEVTEEEVLEESVEETTLDTFFDVFAIDEEQVIEDAEDEAYGLYTTNKAGKNEFIDEEASELKDINDFGIFSLSKGFSRAAVATFSDTKILTGKGEHNSTVGFCVFTISDDHEMVIGNQDYNKIGVTGILNKQVQFEIGDNYILIAVKNDDYFTYRLFKVTVKKEETKGLLENIEVKFIPTVPDVKQPTQSKPKMGLN